MPLQRLKTSPQAEAPAPAVNETELRPYVDIIAARYQSILAALLVGAIAGFVYGWTRPPRYEATATLLISASKIGTDATPVTTPGVRAFVMNKALVAQVLKEFGLDGPPPRLDPLQFITDHLSVEEVAATNLVRVRVWLREPELAARVVNRLVALSTDLSRRINSEESRAVEDFIKAQLDESRTRLRFLEKSLLEYRRDAQIDLRREEVNSLLQQRRELLGLSIQLEGERASLQEAERELGSRPRILPAPRVPNPIAALAPGAGEAREQSASGRDDRQARISPPSTPSAGSVAGTTQSPAPASQLRRTLDQAAASRDRPAEEVAARVPSDTALLSLPYDSPMIDPVYEILEYRVSTGRARVAELDRRRRLLVEQYGLAAPELKQLTELYGHEITEARHQADHDLEAQVYADLFTRYEQARIQVAARSTELKVLDPAIAPRVSSAPSPIVAALLAAIAAAALATLYVFASGYVRAIRAA
jgi:uncharacterized protein involved in exopolysaccharide biosynthesis